MGNLLVWSTSLKWPPVSPTHLRKQQKSLILPNFDTYKFLFVVIFILKIYAEQLPTISAFLLILSVSTTFHYIALAIENTGL